MSDQYIVSSKEQPELFNRIVAATVCHSSLSLAIRIVAGLIETINKNDIPAPDSAELVGLMQTLAEERLLTRGRTFTVFEEQFPELEDKTYDLIYKSKGEKIVPTPSAVLTTADFVCAINVE